MDELFFEHMQINQPRPCALIAMEQGALACWGPWPAGDGPRAILLFLLEPICCVVGQEDDEPRDRRVISGGTSKHSFLASSS